MATIYRITDLNIDERLDHFEENGILLEKQKRSRRKGNLEIERCKNNWR